MKVGCDLFDRITERKTLLAAVYEAARGKRGREAVRAFFRDLESRVARLRSAIRRGDYRFGPYVQFVVRDTKKRRIDAPPFEDRVVHHAMMSVLGPILERSALHHSYACRRGKGQHAALKQLRHWTRRTRWYCKLDIRKYYESIDHGILRRRLRRRFKDGRVLELCDRLIDSWHAAPGKGIPIGALTSQYFANFYLDAFDVQMKRLPECRRYLRYMDDIVVVGPPDEMRRVRQAAREAAAGLALEIKHGGEVNACRTGVPFLGFVTYPDRMRLGRQGRKRLRRKLAHLNRQMRRGAIAEPDYQRRTESIFAHARFADDLAWRQAVILSKKPIDGEDECWRPT